MKIKTLLVVLLALASGLCSAAGRKASAPARDAVRADKLTNLISEYSRKDGFEVIKVGRLGTSLVRGLVKMGLAHENDPESAAVLKAVQGIRKLAVVEYESCSQADKDSFNRKLKRLLDDDSLLMEAKDEGDNFQIHGVVDDKSDKIGNFVLYAPSDCALICLFGTIPLDSITSLMDR